MPVSAIDACFASVRASGRAAALIPYVMAGDPDCETSLEIITALADNGADIIELGVPFSDPMADGPVIQRAAERALAAGSGLAMALDLAERFRRRGGTTPLVLMGYANPVHAMGMDRFAVRAAAASVDGVLVVDMPLGEDADLAQAVAARDIALIRLVTPTSTADRVRAIAEQAKGYVYYVTIAGVTGAGLGDLAGVRDGVARLREAVSETAMQTVPVAVGFGVRTAEQIAALAEFSDAVVVGSALVDSVGRAVADGRADRAPQQVGAMARRFADALR